MEWERLINDYLDDALAPEEVAKLFQWIHAHPDNARRFVDAAFLHRRLQHQLSAIRELEQDAGLTMRDDPSRMSDAAATAPMFAEKTQSAPAPNVRRSKFQSSLTSWRFWGIAAALLLAIGIFSFLISSDGTSARLLAAENAVWGNGVTPVTKGNRFPKGDLVLDSGLIKLGFDNGNQLLIEGPASFSITDARAMTLDRGALTAVVTPAGRGFSVSTPSVRVTDLGTEFGVKANSTATRVIVFSGKVRLDGRPGFASRELTAGAAVEVTSASANAVQFEPAAFKRVMALDVRSLDLVDLIAGGDGTGVATGVGIDAATGRDRQTRAVTTRRGDHQYFPLTNHRVLDGCFIPDGRMQVDSAGDSFSFPTTTLLSYGLIWAGPNIPWEGELAMATTLPDGIATPTSRVLVMHSNNGITFNLDSIRALHAPARVTGFRARVGNSYRSAGPGANPTRTLASIHVIVDGVAQYEKRAFANVDGAIDVNCTLSDKDHFLTLATTDGGDGNPCDWVLWTDPEVLIQSVGATGQ